MQRLNKKEYEAIAELMRGFLEEIELASYNDLPSLESIVKALKLHKYLENGVTAKQLGCVTEGEEVVFVHFDETKLLEDQFIIMKDPLEKGDPVICYVVVLVKTMEEKQKVDSSKAAINLLAKKWLANRVAGRKKSRVQFCTLHTPMRNEKNFSIAINNRIRSLHYVPNTNEAVRIASDVYVAKLFDIVSLYNHIGTELFVRNVRYHIRDVLNVESEIQNTLTNRPADFFNSNNGIAIQIQNRRDLDRRNERDIRLTYAQKGDLSVINGAQTISAAADFFFQIADCESKDNIHETIENAKQNAWVLLRIFYPDNETQENCTSAFDQISISLNRQKPITPTDIEYTCPEVLLINSLYEKNKGNQYYFKLLKRGQEEPGRFQYQLSDFGRIVTAYYHNNPGSARSSSTQDIIWHNSSSDDYDVAEGLGNTDFKSIYAPFGDSTSNDTLFMSWYRPVNFAIEIAKIYSQVEKEYRKEEDIDANILAVLGNGRYFFVAYIVNMLNDIGGPTKKEHSFASFDYNADMVTSSESKLRVSIMKYAELVAQFAGTYLKKNDSERNTLNSNDFKSRSFYQEWCEHTMDDETVLEWNRAIKTILSTDGINKQIVQ